MRRTLQDCFPEIASQWHPTLNGDLRPQDLSPDSHKAVWWKCQAKPPHQWQAIVRVRTRQGVPRCPTCEQQAGSLAARFPELAKQWHPSLNGGLTPDRVGPAVARRVWWRCPKNPAHEWRALIGHRAFAGTGCPICSGKTVIYETSLAALNPEVAAEWHPTKNGELRPDQVGPGSGRRVWWRCPKGPAHEWQAVITKRAKEGSGCPVCSGRKTIPETSLAARWPKVAAEWHPTKNRKLRPDQVGPGSTKIVWWRCPKVPSHEWQAPVSYRAKRYGTKCPRCSKRKVTPGNSLKALHPALMKEWHPTKNGELQPERIHPGTKMRAWWRCSKDPSHEWRAIINTRTGPHRAGCPICSGRKAIPKTSLAALHPKVAAEWHPTKNGDVTPDRVRPGSHKRVWWRCAKDPEHEWQSPIKSRIGPYWTKCPICGGKKVIPKTSLAALNPEVAAEWHPTKNGELRPDQVRPGSMKNVWWRCSRDPEHEWRTTPLCRCKRKAPTGCPVCSGSRVIFKTSLAALNPKVAAEWHPTKNGDVTPDQVRPIGARRVWWRCAKDSSHEWQAVIAKRAREGSGCPLCSGRKPRGE